MIKSILIKISVIVAILTVSLGFSMVKTEQLSTNIAYAADIEFQPVITVKPSTLPGQTANQQQGNTQEGTRAGETTVKSHLLKNVLPNLAVKIIGFASALGLLFLVIAGLRYLVSFGNEDATNNAKTQAIYAIVGLIVAIFSYAIVQIIIGFDFNAK